MRAVRFAEFGIDNITIDEVPDPVPAAGEVLIAVEASTINPVDAGVVGGAMAARLPAGVEPPYTAGWDAAGRVVAVGAGVDESLVGKRVVAFSFWFATGYGLQASRVVLPLENIAVAPEDGLSSAELATIGLNGLTAWRAIEELDPREGESLVIVGAAGSVGGFALELAAARGARVIAVVSERDREVAIELGAADVVTKEQGDLGSAVRGILPDGADALLDTASRGASALDAVRDGGRYASVSAPLESQRDISTKRISVRADATALATLIGLAETGRLHTPVARTFDAAEAQDAYREFISGSRRGRIVLTF